MFKMFITSYYQSYYQSFCSSNYARLVEKYKFRRGQSGSKMLQILPTANFTADLKSQTLRFGFQLTQVHLEKQPIPHEFLFF